MKAYIESLLNEALEQFVEEFHSTSFKVGLWEGDVKLLNLILKRRRFDLGKGVTLSIEYGSIEYAQLTIPWTKLGSGGLKASIDKLSLVCRVYLRNEGDDETNENEVEAYERKMRSLSIQELKQLGMSGDQAWWNQWIASWATSIFSRIASGFELSLTNVNVSILMDVGRNFSDEGQQPPTSVVRISIPAIDIRPPTTVTHDTAASVNASKPVHVDQQDSIDRLFSKDINIRGLTLSVNSINNDDAVRFSQNYSLLAQFTLTDVLLNPLNVTCSSSSQSHAVTTVQSTSMTSEQSGHHQTLRHGEIRTRDTNSQKKQSVRQIPSTHQHQHHQVSLNMHFGNTEWSPTISQIIQISDTAFHMRLAMIRRQIAHLRPGIETYSRPIKGRVSALLWWKYAIEAIILFNGNKRSMSRRTLEDHISHSVQRKQYISLYHRAVSIHLPSQRSSVFRSASKHVQPTTLTEEDMNDLRVLHDWLSESHILQYRATVLRLLHRQGESMTNLKAAAIAYQDMLLTAATSALQQQREKEEEDDDEDMDDDRDYRNQKKKESSIMGYNTTHRGLSVVPSLHLALEQDENRERQQEKDHPVADTGLEFTFRVNLSLSRLSLTVLDARDDDDETENPAAASDFTLRQQPISFTEASMRHAAATGEPDVYAIDVLPR